MINLEEWMDIKQLKRDGHSVRAIARLTGHTRATVRRVLQEQAPKPFDAPDRRSCLDDFKSHIKERHSKFDLSAVRLLDEIRPMGYAGSLRTLRRYVQELEIATQGTARATVRFETPPGHQAQVDWGDCGSFVDAHGVEILLYVFVFVLGFSRTMFVCFTASMDLTVLMRCRASQESGRDGTMNGRSTRTWSIHAPSRLNADPATTIYGYVICPCCDTIGST